MAGRGRGGAQGSVRHPRNSEKPEQVIIFKGGRGGEEKGMAHGSKPEDGDYEGRVMQGWAML